jgi:hypothetical protein
MPVCRASTDGPREDRVDLPKANRGNDDEGFINSSRYQLFGNSFAQSTPPKIGDKPLVQMKPSSLLKNLEI